MMKLFSIKDFKAGTFTQPTMFRTTDEAIRNFAIVVNTDGNLVHDCPKDFALYEVGLFDVESGCITCDCINIVADAIQLVKVGE